jgi:mono/diheme cytochrome c family protein
MPHTFQKLLTRGLLVAGLAGAVGVSSAGDQACADAMIERGRYLAQLGGCNDCHTSGYLLGGGQIPESEWLKGDSFGWRGPWGTTYAPNLRLFMKDLTEDGWVEVARTLKRRPPMPWYTVNKMHEDDLRAFYRFVVSLGDPGVPAPSYVPPDQEPSPPYALFPSPPQTQ